jgi:hypothetical protein
VGIKRCLIALMINFLTANSSRQPSIQLANRVSRARMIATTTHSSNSELIKRRKGHTRPQQPPLVQRRVARLRIPLPRHHTHHLLLMIKRTLLHQVMSIQHHLLRNQIFLRASLTMEMTIALIQLTVQMLQVKLKKIDKLRDFTKRRVVIQPSLLAVVLTLVKNHHLILDLQRPLINLKKMHQLKKKSLIY